MPKLSDFIVITMLGFVLHFVWDLKEWKGGIDEWRASVVKLDSTQNQNMVILRSDNTITSGNLTLLKEDVIQMRADLPKKRKRKYLVDPN